MEDTMNMMNDQFAKPAIGGRDLFWGLLSCYDRMELVLDFLENCEPPCPQKYHEDHELFSLALQLKEARKSDGQAFERELDKTITNLGNVIKVTSATDDWGIPLRLLAFLHEHRACTVNNDYSPKERLIIDALISWSIVPPFFLAKSDTDRFYRFLERDLDISVPPGVWRRSEPVHLDDDATPSGYSKLPKKMS